MDKGSILVLAAAVMVLATAVGVSVIGEKEIPWPDDDSSYTEKELTAYMYEVSETDTITVRYYDETPNTPYVSLSAYYKMLQDGEMSITYDDGGRYILTNHKEGGGQAVLNVKT
ncbi:MAG: hypothetical protein J6O90_06110 [Candidatus Methanomethylophilaceae archaeon]|nr:hypothetical protein [Candidatus Methanomethylophilaceae archaeon]